MSRVKLRRLVWLGSALLALAVAPQGHTELQRPKLVQGEGEHVAGFFTAGPGGAVFRFPGKASVELEPGTQLRVFARSQRLRMPEGYAVDTWSVVLKRGRVQVHVPKPKKVAILLSASSDFSSVIAQGSGVAIVDSEEYIAANLEGVSHTITKGRWQVLPPSSVRSYQPGSKLSVTKPTLGPTEVLPGRRLWMSPRRAVTLDGFKWQPIQGAQTYSLALSRSGESAPIAHRTTSEATLSEPLGPIGPGSYQLRVRAMDERGLPGKWSNPVELRVVGVDLPAGAYVSTAGDINLGAGQHARFTNAEGLELTYSGAHRTVSASTLVPLHQGQRTLVSVRRPGSLDVAVAKLVPRRIAAEVQIGPKTARWPRDEVQISIQLHALDAEPPPVQIQPRPRVTIGIEPIQLDWHWDGSVLKAAVPARHDKGPWVVRVEVEDQFGLPLGRDLLEIVPMSSEDRRVSQRP